MTSVILSMLSIWLFMNTPYYKWLKEVHIHFGEQFDVSVAVVIISVLFVTMVVEFVKWKTRKRLW